MIRFGRPSHPKTGQDYYLGVLRYIQKVVKLPITKLIMKQKQANFTIDFYYDVTKRKKMLGNLRSVVSLQLCDFIMGRGVTGGRVSQRYDVVLSPIAVFD